ncbi:MAG: GHKL domain-containing protein, partial [Clostridia bacterium]|nr:GHKL domain-containing protein [Clostridia bacterium]
EAVAELEDKRIELHFLKQNSNRIILCRNTIGESVLTKNRQLKTTKKDTASHGFGHVIIERIVQDYDGMVDYFEEDGMFGVQVILPVNEVRHIPS